jgi:hypothetical protein
MDTSIALPFPFQARGVSLPLLVRWELVVVPGPKEASSDCEGDDCEDIPADGPLLRFNDGE